MFEKAQSQIFQLMKYDSYTRFLKSNMYKDCIMSEMEGKSLPFTKQQQQQQQQQQHLLASSNYEERTKAIESLVGHSYGSAVRREKQCFYLLFRLISSRPNWKKKRRKTRSAVHFCRGRRVTSSGLTRSSSSSFFSLAFIKWKRLSGSCRWS